MTRLIHFLFFYSMKKSYKNKNYFHALRSKSKKRVATIVFFFFLFLSTSLFPSFIMAANAPAFLTVHPEPALASYRSSAKHVSGQHKAQECPTAIERATNLDIYLDPVRERKSGIICTIGPACIDVLDKLQDAGMNVVRMNFSHGDYEWHQRVIDTARATEAKNPTIPLAIALDTKGPEIRTGLMKSTLSEIHLEMGSKVTITTDDQYKEQCDNERIWLDYVNITKVIKVDDLIYIDDGLVSLKVLEIVDDKTLSTEVINTGIISSRKGVNLPNVDVDLPALSAKDKKDLAFGVKNNVDMIFASFIRKKSDIEEIREVLGAEGKDIKIIAKIENHEGVRNFDQILEATDGVMVARGDLGIEIPAQKVFLAQKMMISKCNLVGKPVICATQMLESMTGNPRPTRAEVSDVANAVIDGSDCVMLSGETAKGKYPTQAVAMMHKISREAESSISYKILHDEIVSLQAKPSSVEDAIAASAVAASYQTMAGAIVVLTTSGRSAQCVSKFKPSCQIITVTRNRTTARQCHLYRGCTPLWYNKERKDDWNEDVEARFEAAFEFGKARGVLVSGDVVLGLQGSRKGSGTTNTLRFLVCP